MHGGVLGREEMAEEDRPRGSCALRGDGDGA